MEQCRAAAEGLGYDSAAAAGLEADAERQRGEVQRLRDQVDVLGSQLAGEMRMGAVAGSGGILVGGLLSALAAQFG